MKILQSQAPCKLLYFKVYVGNTLSQKTTPDFVRKHARFSQPRRGGVRARLASMF